MTNNTIKNRIRTELENNEVLVNKITISGITRNENEFMIKKIILSLDAPQDNDIAKILRCRQNLENQNIFLATVLIEL